VEDMKLIKEFKYRSFPPQAEKEKEGAWW